MALSSRLVLLGATAALTFSAACVGELGGGGPSPGVEPRPAAAGGTAPVGPGTVSTGGAGGAVAVLPPPRCNASAPIGPAPLRRLTRAEFRATVKDLLGVTLKADPYTKGSAAGFDNDISELSVSAVTIEQQLEDAEEAAKAALADPTKLLTCDIKAPDDACVRKLVTTLGQRAFRRPLDAGEVQSVFASYTAGATGADPRMGLEVMLQHLLLAPAFTYRVELGQPAAAGKPRPLTSWEMASRLSYFLWGTMPDPLLLAAAADGKLVTSEQIAAQVRRMIRDPAGAPVAAARATVASFHSQWLGLRDIDTLAKDQGKYPTFAGLKSSIRKETERFTEELFWNRGAVTDLLGARHSYLDQALAGLYKVPGVTGPDLVKVNLDPNQRAGILTQASFLAQVDSPIRRGKFIRERILCTEIPPPNKFSLIQRPRCTAMFSPLNVDRFIMNVGSERKPARAGKVMGRSFSSSTFTPFSFS